MEVKLNTDNGFVRLRIADDRGDFLTYVHVQCFKDEVSVYVPDQKDKNVSIQSVSNELKKATT